MSTQNILYCGYPDSPCPSNKTPYIHGYPRPMSMDIHRTKHTIRFLHCICLAESRKDTPSLQEHTLSLQAIDERLWSTTNGFKWLLVLRTLIYLRWNNPFSVCCITSDVKSLTGSTWNSLHSQQVQPLAGYIGLGEERETENEIGGRIQKRLCKKVAAKKQYEWGRYTFVDLFA